MSEYMLPFSAVHVTRGSPILGYTGVLLLFECRPLLLATRCGQSPDEELLRAMISRPQAVQERVAAIPYPALCALFMQIFTPPVVLLSWQSLGDKANTTAPWAAYAHISGPQAAYAHRAAEVKGRQRGELSVANMFRSP